MSSVCADVPSKHTSCISVRRMGWYCPGETEYIFLPCSFLIVATISLKVRNFKFTAVDRPHSDHVITCIYTERKHQQKVNLHKCCKIHFLKQSMNIYIQVNIHETCDKMWCWKVIHTWNYRNEILQQVSQILGISVPYCS